MQTRKILCANAADATGTALPVWALSDTLSETIDSVGKLNCSECDIYSFLKPKDAYTTPTIHRWAF